MNFRVPKIPLTGSWYHFVSYAVASHKSLTKHGHVGTVRVDQPAVPCSPMLPFYGVGYPWLTPLDVPDGGPG